MKNLIYSIPFVLFLFFSIPELQAQTISGVVTDSNGEGLPGITVLLKNTEKGTQTDFEGKYKIEIDSAHRTLIFRFVGFSSEEVTVNEQTVINVVLKEESISMSEVVVVAHGFKIRGQSSVARISSGNRYQQSERYKYQVENEFKSVSLNPLSTFSVDVDKASYSNVRRYLEYGDLPPEDAVRTEELINYFHYTYPKPQGEDVFSTSSELSKCPWNSDNLLLKIGLNGKEIPEEDLPPSNIVFLLDVSGSMSDENKLPLLKTSLKLLLTKLDADDKVAIVVYAGSSGLALPSTSCTEKKTILAVLDRLNAGGSTAGGEGLELAYKIAQENFIKNGNNRIILATDGDFNVGIDSEDDVTKYIEKKRDSGIAISVLGFGMGNIKDDLMEAIADKGNGNYAYIDNQLEAKKVLVKEFGGTLFTIAKDVKLQVEFNPKFVSKYRLIGYENRMLDEEDFEDDKKDAGEVGSGHSVTALYELILKKPKSIKTNSKLKYQTTVLSESGNSSNEIASLKIRYKKPTGNKSTLVERSIINEPIELTDTSDDFKFCASIVQFSMLLKKSKFTNKADWDSTLQLANEGLGKDPDEYRKEFIKLIERAEQIEKRGN